MSNAPYRKLGECLPDRPLPPTIVLPKPKGNGIWINMLGGRPKKVPGYLSRFGLVHILIFIACSIFLAAVIIFALESDLKDLEPSGDCSCSCSPEPCTCSCDHGQ